MALEESGLGEAIVGWGLEDELRQPTFAIGLKGVSKEDIPKVEKLVEDTIAKIAEDGFTQAAIDSSVNTIEYPKANHATEMKQVSAMHVVKMLRTFLRPTRPP